jgi:hypothetical protein
VPESLSYFGDVIAAFEALMTSGFSMLFLEAGDIDSN